MAQNSLALRRGPVHLAVLMAVSKFKELGFRARARRAKTKYWRHIESGDRRWGGRRLKLSGKSVTPIPLGKNELVSHSRSLSFLEVFGLFEVEVLDLSTERTSCLDFRLDRLPREIGYLYRLRVLNLDVNALTSLPNEISELNHLECLTVSCNKLQTLPWSYKKLIHLQSLHLASNCFQAFPLVICHMLSLTFLDLSCNQIRLLPPMLSRVTHLRTLMLFNNKIDLWPDALCDLLDLHTLWLGKNQLTHLPTRFGQLKDLDWTNYQVSSNIDDNPLITPPLNVCQLGIQAIREFLQMEVTETTSLT